MCHYEGVHNDMATCKVTCKLVASKINKQTTKPS